MFFFLLYVDHLDLHVLTHSFPTRRSSDLSSSHESRKPPVLRWWPHRTREGSAACRARCLKDRAIHVGIRCGSWICTRQSLLGFPRSEEHTSELQSLMRISYAVFCLKKKKH